MEYAYFVAGLVTTIVVGVLTTLFWYVPRKARQPKRETHAASPDTDGATESVKRNISSNFDNKTDHNAACTSTHSNEDASLHAMQAERDSSSGDFTSPTCAASITNPLFHYLDASDLSDPNNPKPIQINSRQPIPLENDMCVGSGLVITRTDPLDPFYAPYLGGKERMFEIRVSLRFKSQPKGILFMGGEVPQRMKLGLVTRSAAKALLSFISRFATGLVHASFGNVDDNGSLIDTPHIALPIWQFAERMVVTPQGESPPPITEELFEPDSVRKARLKSKLAPFPLDTKHTYTFSFHTKYIDVMTWKVRGMGVGKLSLSTFWDYMPMRLVVYDLDEEDESVTSKLKTIHLNAKKRMYLCVSIQNTIHRRSDLDTPLVEFPEIPKVVTKRGKQYGDTEASTGSTQSSCKGNEAGLVEHKEHDSMNESRIIGKQIRDTLVDSEEDVSVMNIQSGSTATETSSLGKGESVQLKLPNVVYGSKGISAKDSIRVAIYVIGYITYYDLSSKKNSTAFSVLVRSQSTGKAWMVLRTNNDFVVAAPNTTISTVKNVAGALRRKTSSVLPKTKAWPSRKSVIDSQSRLESYRNAYEKVLLETGREKLYPKTFALQHKQADLMVAKHVTRSSFGVRSSIRFKDNESNQSRASSVMLHEVHDETSSMLNPMNVAGRVTRRRSRTTTAGSLNSNEQVILESVVLRAKWETYWLEEWAMVVCSNEVMVSDLDKHQQQHCSKDAAVVLFPGGSRKPSCIISVKSILRVTPGEQHTLDIKSKDRVTGLAQLFPCIYIETVGKVHVLCLRDEELCHEWMDCLTKLINGNNTHDGSFHETSDLDSIGKDVHDTRLVILDDDDRRDSSTLEDGEPSGSPSIAQGAGVFDLAPCKRWDSNKRVILNSKHLVFNTESVMQEDICEKSCRILKLALNLNDNSSRTEMRAFFDAASEFKSMDLATLGVDQQRIASFFLNLYHTILLHARILVGQPSSLWGWGTFGTQMCYQVGLSHVFSLAEIEHCIVRYSMVNAKFLNLVQVTQAQTAYTRGFGLSIQYKSLTFAVNHFTQSELDVVPVYHPTTVWKQIDAYAMELLAKRVQVDERRGIVTLPKICQWYRMELGSDLKDMMNSLFPLTRGEMRAMLLRVSQLGNGKLKYAKHDWCPMEDIFELPCRSTVHYNKGK